MQDPIQKNKALVFIRLCPTCHGDLVAMDYRGVIIDQCSRCNGFWVERGAMEKIIHPTCAPEPATDCCKTVVYETWVNRDRQR